MIDEKNYALNQGVLACMWPCLKTGEWHGIFGRGKIFACSFLWVHVYIFLEQILTIIDGYLFVGYAYMYSTNEIHVITVQVLI